MLGHALQDAFADLKPTCWDRDEIDIADQQKLEQKLLALQPDIIINAAAYTNVDKAEEEEELHSNNQRTRDVRLDAFHALTDLLITISPKVASSDTAMEESTSSAVADGKIKGEVLILSKEEEKNE